MGERCVDYLSHTGVDGGCPGFPAGFPRNHYLNSDPGPLPGTDSVFADSGRHTLRPLTTNIFTPTSNKTRWLIKIICGRYNLIDLMLAKTRAE